MDIEAWTWLASAIFVGVAAGVGVTVAFLSWLLPDEEAAARWPTDIHHHHHDAELGRRDMESAP